MTAENEQKARKIGFKFPQLGKYFFATGFF